MLIKICEKCHKPITCPLDACVCHAIKSEREKIIEWAEKRKEELEEPIRRREEINASLYELKYLKSPERMARISLLRDLIDYLNKPSKE